MKLPTEPRSLRGVSAPASINVYLNNHVEAPHRWWGLALSLHPRPAFRASDGSAVCRCGGCSIIVTTAGLRNILITQFFCNRTYWTWKQKLTVTSDAILDSRPAFQRYFLVVCISSILEPLMVVIRCCTVLTDWESDAFGLPRKYMDSCLPTKLHQSSPETLG